MSEVSLGKSQCSIVSSSVRIDFIETMNQERVYSINRISPDSNLDDWKISPSTEKKSLLIKNINGKFKEPNSFDISIQIGADIFNCFFLTLQSYSNFFKSRSIHERVINLSSSRIASEVFIKIYEWMIKSSKLIERDDLILLLMGAQYLEVELLKQQIWNLIQDGDKFQECEAFLLYVEAKLCGCEKVKDMMMHRVQQFFMTVVCSEEFLEMEPDEIQKWLNLDSIGINMEVEVFYAAALWLFHDWEERKSNLLVLMKCVRFGLISPWRIVEFRLNKNMGRLTEILRNSELQIILESSLSYATYRSCFQDYSCAQFNDFLHRFDFQRLHPRENFNSQWQTLYKNSSYRFEDFEEYLRILKANAFTSWRSKFKNKIVNCPNFNV